MGGGTPPWGPAVRRRGRRGPRGLWRVLLRLPQPQLMVRVCVVAVCVCVCAHEDVPNCTGNMWISVYICTRTRSVHQHTGLCPAAPFDVMLTCYTLFERDTTEQKLDRRCLSKFAWSHVVLDEAHALKNAASARTRALRRYAGSSVWQPTLGALLLLLIAAVVYVFSIALQNVYIYKCALSLLTVSLLTVSLLTFACFLSPHALAQGVRCCPPPHHADRHTPAERPD